MNMTVTPSGQACGAQVSGVDLARELDEELIADIRDAWIEHGVIAFPNQFIDDDELERFTTYFGNFGEDPFVQPIPGRKHIIEIQRKADETSSIFAEAWHSDWSFQSTPPTGTCLYRIIIPESGATRCSRISTRRWRKCHPPCGKRLRVDMQYIRLLEVMRPRACTALRMRDQVAVCDEIV